MAKPLRRQRCLRVKARKATASAQPMERPDVLSLAEYAARQLNAETRDKYCDTLPFGPSHVTPRKLVSLIEKTRADWDWYKFASESWPGLGTLGYFPQEIRDRIFEKVLLDHIRRVCRFESCCAYRYDELPVDCEFHSCRNMLQFSTWSYMPKAAVLSQEYSQNYFEVFDLKSLLPIMQNDHHFSIVCRRVSNEIRLEIDHVLLSYSALRFNCPAAFSHFMNALSHCWDPRMSPTFRNLVLELYGFCECCPRIPTQREWMDACGLPPQNLGYVKSITFVVGDMAHPVSFCEYDGSMRGSLQHSPTKVDHIEKVADLLEVVSKQMARWAPRAEISLLGAKWFLEEDTIILESVLSEVERMNTLAEKATLEEDCVPLTSGICELEEQDDETYTMVDESYFETG